MTIAEFSKVLEAVTFHPSWTFAYRPYRDGWLLWVEFLSPFEKPWQRQLQKGRKLYVSPHSTESEVVQTCWLAVHLALEHEAREMFSYKQKVVFGPHIAINAHIAKADDREVRAQQTT